MFYVLQVIKSSLHSNFKELKGNPCCDHKEVVLTLDNENAHEIENHIVDSCKFELMPETPATEPSLDYKPLPETLEFNEEIEELIRILRKHSELNESMIIHDESNKKRNFYIGQKVLFYDFVYCWGELEPEWTGPYIVTSIYPTGLVKIKRRYSNQGLRVIGQRLKPFLELPKKLGEE